MKKYLYILVSIFIVGACNNDNDEPAYTEVDFKEEMRNFVIGISQYAKDQNPNFLVIPQNGIELVTQDGDYESPRHYEYADAIDGNGQEDLFYGYIRDDKETPEGDSEYLKDFLNISKSAGNKILVTDYCSTSYKMDDSYEKNNNEGYVSFAARDRDLDEIPTYPSTIYSENNNIITGLNQIKNFLYLINPEKFTSKQEFISAITQTNYDLLIMDLFFNEDIEFTNTEISQLKAKANGGERLVISYMSIGEAEDYRYYWQSDWNTNKPVWLENLNPDWEGNYKVRYWYAPWQDIIFGNDDSYLKKILDAGFDGVYLDIIDAFEYYE